MHLVIFDHMILILYPTLLLQPFRQCWFLWLCKPLHKFLCREFPTDKYWNFPLFSFWFYFRFLNDSYYIMIRFLKKTLYLSIENKLIIMSAKSFLFLYFEKALIDLSRFDARDLDCLAKILIKYYKIEFLSLVRVKMNPKLI